MAHIVDQVAEFTEFLKIFEEPENEYLNHTIIEEFSRPRNIAKEFIMSKHAEGCTIETCRTYYAGIKTFLGDYRDKALQDINSGEIKSWLLEYQERHHLTNGSLDNLRRYLNSFYNFLVAEDYIVKNPMTSIHRIKADKTLHLPFTEDDLEKIRDACESSRELALIDFLYSTGARVSEAANSDIADFNFQAMEGYVYGKGGKERIVYLDTRAKIHLLRYLHFRKDTNPALFVEIIGPYNRMTKCQIEYTVKQIGKRAGIENCHPHRFRRTLSTRLLERGMPIEQVQAILGHEKLDTTLIYAKVNQTSVKLNHSKFA